MPAILPVPPVLARPTTVIYENLRRLARKHLARERRDHTLQPTALAHEAYLRLAGQTCVLPAESGNLLIAASGVMRAVLVDHARRKRALKRGGDQQRVRSSEEPSTIGPPVIDILALDESLNRLRELDADLASIVELRYFGGLNDPEIAAARNCTTRTVRRAWKVAKAWLAHELRS